MGQSPGAVGLAVSLIIRSGRQETVIDPFDVSDAQAELSRGRDVSWLAEKQVLRSVVKKIPVIACDALRIVVQGYPEQLGQLPPGGYRVDR